MVAIDTAGVVALGSAQSPTWTPSVAYPMALIAYRSNSTSTGRGLSFDGVDQTIVASDQGASPLLVVAVVRNITAATHTITRTNDTANRGSLVVVPLTGLIGNEAIEVLDVVRLVSGTQITFPTTHSTREYVVAFATNNFNVDMTLSHLDEIIEDTSVSATGRLAVAARANRDNTTGWAWTLSPSASTTGVGIALAIETRTRQLWPRGGNIYAPL